MKDVSESEESDVQVIDDEDLELAAQIEKERKEKRAQKLKEKREKEGKTPKKQAKKKATPKRRRVGSSDEDDDDEDESPKKPAKKTKRRGKSSEIDSDDEVVSKKTKKDKKKKENKNKKVESSESEESDEEEVKVRKSKKKSSLKKRRRTDSSESSEESDASESDKPRRNTRAHSRGKSASKSESEEKDSEEERASNKRKKGKLAKKAAESDESDVPKKKSSSKKHRKESLEEDEDSEDEKNKKVKKTRNSEKRKTKKSSVDTDDEVPKSRKHEKSKKRKHPKSSSEEEEEESEIESSEPEKSESDSEQMIVSKKKKRDAVGRVSVEKSDESDPEVIPEPKKRRTIVSSEEEEKDSDGDKKKTKKADKKKKMESESESKSESESEDDNDSSDGSIEMNRKSKRKAKKEPEKKKKGIIMDSADLAKETIDAEKAEKDRRKRLEKKQKEFNGIILEEGEDLTELLTGTSSHRKLKSVVLDPDSSGDPKTPVEVHNSLVRILKPHQAHGIQFMYDCAFESLDRLDTEGSGGILAHCMGLGKTLQVITFLHTVMNHEKLGEKCKRVLVVVPKNVIINWFKEFQKWLLENDEELDTIQVKELDSYKDVDERRRALQRWHNCKNPSVMIIGYDMFRILTCEDDPKRKKTKLSRKLTKAKEDFRKYLQNPGPDLIVCDEAHKLKNDESALSKCMVKIKTKRRLCLTGTPLQNNLMEYHCMVNFVKPGLLGTKTEFANRFVNIINRGRTKDASSLEVSFMKRRCHVLYDHLKKCVDRKDYRVLTEAIPPKQEYVINVRLTERQCALYTTFLNDVVGNTGLSKRLLPDYHMFSRIWTHPYQLILHEQRLERERMLKEDAEEEADFIDDSASESEESVLSYSSQSESEASFVASSDEEGGSKKKNNNKKDKKEKKAPKSTRRGRGNDDEDGEDAAMNILQEGIRSSRRLAGEDADIRDTDTPPEYNGWFSKMVSDDDRDDYTLSNKLVLLMQIIKKCEEIGDKLLVFSQSLESLSLIKRMLEYMAGTGQWFADGHEALNQEGETWSWLEGEDYMVIDGSVQTGKRDSVQTHFNSPENLRARLMLISTRAGSLGTNMVAANRVIIFDACWNPSHDTQSLFRVYRFGQTKPVYIYRFIAQGTMEERIYKRQVTKESTSMRVVDEAQIQRHYLGHDLTELYQFTPSEFDPDVEIACAPPKDRLLADVIHQNPSAVVDYIEHDTLFANVEEEKLTEQEMRDAWTDYEKDKSGLPPVRPQYDPGMLRGMAIGGPGGMIVGQNMQAMLQNRYNEAVRIDQLQNDLLFKELNKMRLKDVGTSLKIVLLRNLLEQILPYIPVEMRGGMSEFNTHFIRLVHETDRKNETPADLLRKSLESFKTVIKMVRAIPTCTEPLARMARQYPYLFTE
ncbi:CRE-XNP-1 protein [Caenorhabditis remanei]|uniref:CRE-XNP-1 protein n=1 Tax=Caenorhabditis remanei TaxID=31234 RepID=E3LXK7_CAERE|nr:CRE-XNP-1 protein [Caenorhabditis remanei]